MTAPITQSWNGDAMLLLIAPESEIPERYIEDLKFFLSNGNCVLIVSDDECHNDLLIKLGSSIRIHNATIISVDRFFDDPSSVIAYPTGEDPLSEGIPHLVFNDPGYLEGGSPIFSTSILTFHDMDNNQRLSKGELFEKFSLVSRDSVSNGTLYVISDPSIFINGMLGINPTTGNKDFIDNILSYKNITIVEQKYSKISRGESLSKLIDLIKNTKPLQMIIVTFSMFLLALVIPFGRR